MLRIRIGELKLHLRREADDTGVLIINAQAALFLDRVASAYYEAFFDEFGKLASRLGAGEDTAGGPIPSEPQSLSPLARIFGKISDAALDSTDISNPREVGMALAPKVIQRIRRKFRVDAEQAAADWERLWGSVLAVAEGGMCPFSDFEVRRIAPLSVELKAPYRCDLILTYRCQNDCAHCYAGGPHVTNEISTESWKQIIDRLADWGVPTVVFTGGEPLLYGSIVQLVRHAEDKGLITGLITNGRLLTEPKVNELADAGLDFAQVTLESVDPGIHDKMVGVAGAWAEAVDGIRNAASKIYTTTNTTITKDNADTVLETIRFVKSLGVEKFGLNALIRSRRGVSHEGVELPELKSLIEEVIRVSADEDFPFIWYTPTCYKELNPVALALGVKTCSAASTVMAIEPDGNVMPCQSYYKSIGNALIGEFPDIWNHPLARALRNRREPGVMEHPGFPALPEECVSCEELSLCGGACPLERALGLEHALGADGSRCR
ncbi:MAG: radical SAM protein [Bacillota bacterium]|jgi:radical SAM protein with 4Fe4S-binding SPASM domain